MRLIDAEVLNKYLHSCIYECMCRNKSDREIISTMLMTLANAPIAEQQEAASCCEDCIYFDDYCAIKKEFVSSKGWCLAFIKQEGD